jgi:hypothetical protein
LKDNENRVLVFKNIGRMGFLALESNRETVFGKKEVRQS